MSEGPQRPREEAVMEKPKDEPTATDPPTTAEHSPSSRNSPESQGVLRSRSRTSLGKRQRDDSEAPSNKRRRSSTDDTAAALATSSKIAKTTSHDSSDTPPSKLYDTASTNPNQQIDGTGSSPYGTRSRNRGGASRPNYAEDDGDFEFLASRKSTRETKANLGNDVEKSGGSSGRRSGGGVAMTRSSSSAVGKDSQPSQPVPSTSSFAVMDEGGSESQTSAPKKRKAASTQSSTIGASNSNTQAQTSTATRKQSGGVSSSVTHGDLAAVSFTNSGAYLSKGALVADDKTRYQPNDWVYLVCEPPGEPYYLARIMDFLHKENDTNAPVDAIKVNSIYRPRDIGRKTIDSRLVFASMQAETCPITSLRGKCRIEHRSRITDLDVYRRQKDCFYFNQLYERFIHRFYDMVPREKITNISAPLKKIIDEQWEFIISEPAKTKELTAASKTCRVCGEYCANNESVDCAVCKNTYHMNCVDPPLAKKPARGFAWSCGPCSRKQERKLEARNTPMVEDGEDEEMLDDDEAQKRAKAAQAKGSSPVVEKEMSPKHQTATKEQIAEARTWPWRYLGVHSSNEDLLDFDDRIYPRASSRIGPRHQANVPVWHGRPIEYVEPEAKRKHAKGAGNKKESRSKDALALIEAEKLAREKKPWLVDRPAGYVERSGDFLNNDPKNTAKLLSRPAQYIDSARASRDTSVDPSRNATRSSTRLPEVGEVSTRGLDLEDSDNLKPPSRLNGTDRSEGSRSRAESEAVREQNQAVMDQYMKDARDLAQKTFGVPAYNTEFLDKAVAVINELNFDAAAALDKLASSKIKFVKFEGNDLKKFEEAVAKYGSSLMDITRHVKTRHYGEIVRFYYTWKKSTEGEKIWGNYRDRKAKKAVKKEENIVQVDDIADDADDSAFDSGKAATKKRAFECKFCQTRESRVWRRAPQLLSGINGPENVARPNKNSAYTTALCSRCALLWRKYATVYDNLEELAKKISQTGGRAFKRRENEDTFIELLNGNIESSTPIGPSTQAAAQIIGIPVPASLTVPPPDLEAPRKRQRVAGEKELPAPVQQPPELPKKKVPEKPPEPALIPEQPKLRALPCAVCNGGPSESEEILCCRHCRMSVHRNCYGIPKCKSAAKWACDPCNNDTTYQFSTDYKCILCPSYQQPIDVYEPLKPMPKKKTEREKEKERLEKEMLADAKDDYARKQTELGRPVSPREPLKPTSGNKWIHVTCANWISQIKFPDPAAFDRAEGMLAIPSARFNQTCKICNTAGGVCISCLKCSTSVHVSCAHHHEYQMGFDVTPVKSSRRDAVDSITLGTDKNAEKGNAEAVVYCPEHVPKNILHPINEPTNEEGVNALQLFARHFKQADNSLTGALRKAALINTKANAHGGGGVSGHRPSLAAISTAANKMPTEPAPVVKLDEMDEEGDRVFHLVTSPTSETPPLMQCVSCNTTTSAKFYKQERYLHDYHRPNGGEAETKYVCHRCYKRKGDFVEKDRAKRENPDLTVAQLYPKIRWPSKTTPAPPAYQQSPYGTPPASNAAAVPAPVGAPVPPPPPPPPSLPQQKQPVQQPIQQPPPTVNGVGVGAVPARHPMPPPSPTTVVSPYGVAPARHASYYEDHLRHRPPPQSGPMSPQHPHVPPIPPPMHQPGHPAHAAQPPHLHSPHQHPHQLQHPHPHQAPSAPPPPPNGYLHRPPSHMPPHMPPQMHHRPPHINTSPYAHYPPPSASPTSGSYRSAGTPLRSSDDPFATIPAQSPRLSYGPLQTSPRLKTGGDPKEHGGPPPPPERREPPVANGASASPSLRHLIH